MSFSSSRASCLRAVLHGQRDKDHSVQCILFCIPTKSCSELKSSCPLLLPVPRRSNRPNPHWKLCLPLEREKEKKDRSQKCWSVKVEGLSGTQQSWSCAVPDSTFVQLSLKNTVQLPRQRTVRHGEFVPRVFLMRQCRCNGFLSNLGRCPRYRGVQLQRFHCTYKRPCEQNIPDNAVCYETKASNQSIKSI